VGLKNRGAGCSASKFYVAAVFVRFMHQQSGARSVRSPTPEVMSAYCLPFSPVILCFCLSYAVFLPLSVVTR
jgi:hypothetical protein